MKGRPNAYAMLQNPSLEGQDKMTGITHGVDGIKLDDQNPIASGSATSKIGVLTQGDKLNQIKARRRVATIAPLSNSTRPSPVIQ